MELTQFEKTGTNEAKLTVKVTAEEFGRAVDAAIREKGKKLTVPGFRKGKAPKALLEKAYGREYFYQDAVNETYGYAYDAAVKQADIPLTVPTSSLLNVPRTATPLLRPLP